MKNKAKNITLSEQFQNSIEKHSRMRQKRYRKHIHTLTAHFPGFTGTSIKSGEVKPLSEIM
jgi:hypothetical protein